MLAIVLATAFAPRVASAHTTGVSQSDLVVGPNGVVDAELVFALAEIASAVALDANHDGAVSEEELAAARPDLRRLVLDGLDVRADDRPCAAALQRVELTEADGLLLDVRFACPADARRLDATYFLLSELARGHRHAARITQGARSVQKLLSGTNRAIAFDLDAPPRAPSSARRVALVVVTIAWAVAMVALFVWRFRRARPKKARRPPTS